MIWEAALPGPRIVNVFQRPLKKTIGEWEEDTGLSWPILPPPEPDDDDDNREWEQNAIRSEILEALGKRWDDYDEYREGHLIGMSTKCPPPQILSVCKESYNVAKAQYTQAFNTLGSTTGIWFSFSLDTFYFRYDNFGHYTQQGRGNSINKLGEAFINFPIDDADKVQNLAILLDPQDFPSPTAEQLGRSLACFLRWPFHGVRKLSLVTSNYARVGRDFERDTYGGISLIDPIDVVAILARMEEGQIPSKSQSRLEFPMLDTWCSDLELKLVEDELLHDLVGDPMPLDWKAPKFERKVAVSDEILEELDSARRSWEEHNLTGSSKP
jgi:predicted nucleotidyltransferase